MLELPRSLQYRKVKMKNAKAVDTDIVLIDIINFSKLKLDEQLEIVTFLNRSFKKVIEKMLSSSKMDLATLVHGLVSTGDGFYCILNPRFKGYGAILALSFNHFSEQISKKYSYFLGIRVAVHTGYVHSFKDILGNENFIGDGLNDCSRYLEFKNYTISTVIVSDVAYEHFRYFLQKYKDFHDLLVSMGFKHSDAYVFKDKHGGIKKGYLVWLRKPGIIIPPAIHFQR